jgi:hypothetical protein|tara:strand:- start:3752 stop:4159 length:408 start_codon:yes stop_codon:yes gene_type:complete
MSRKKVNVSADKVKMLASFGCSTVEIAKYFECDASTIRKRFKDVIAAGKEEMKFSLRRSMWTSAHENGSVAMQIFLAKNILNMSDKTAIDMSGNLETVLKECGFEDNPLVKANNKQKEAMESLGVQPNSTATGIS